MRFLGRKWQIKNKSKDNGNEISHSPFGNAVAASRLALTRTEVGAERFPAIISAIGLSANEV
jgi:hypothetical protein